MFGGARYVDGQENGYPLTCPLHLPDGARLVSAMVDVVDQHPNGRILRIDVLRTELGTPQSVEEITVYPDSGSISGLAETPGHRAVEFPIEAADESMVIVDNATYAYELVIVISPSTLMPDPPAWVGVFGASLTYDIERWVAG